MPTPQTIQKPLISFIITDYNLPVDMLRECIDSILALSLQQEEREIILVDDGSDMSPMGELPDLQDQLTYIRQPNGGVSSARNRGLQMSNGQYIQFVDGDDCLIKAPYDFCIDIARRFGPDLISFYFRHDGKEIACNELPAPVSGSHYMYTQNLRGSVGSYLFRRDCLGSLRFSKGIRYGEDEEFTAQLYLRAETVYATKAQAYFYRMHEGSAVHDLSPDGIMQRLDDTEHVIVKLHTLLDHLPRHHQEALRRRIAQLTMDYLYNTMRLTKNHDELELRMERLRAKNLYPLPDKAYTAKYMAFRHMVNSRLGTNLLLAMLSR